MKNNQPKSKGGARPGAGRPAGVPNKVTQEFRDTIRKVLDDNANNVGRWLTLVAEGDGTDSPKGAPDPGRALDLLAKLAEFAAPKLSRAEVTGANGEPVQTITRIELVPLKNDNGSD